jgi:hypothetical protein
MQVEFINGAPPGSICACHAAGWIQSDLFKQSFGPFVHHVNPGEEDPVLLMSDGHYSHNRNFVCLFLARQPQ